MVMACDLWLPGMNRHIGTCGNDEFPRNASFSVCEYLCSTSVSDLLPSPTKKDAVSLCCTSMAQSPTGLASTTTSVFRSGLKYAILQCRDMEIC